MLKMCIYLSLNTLKYAFPKSKIPVWPCPVYISYAITVSNMTHFSSHNCCCCSFAAAAKSLQSCPTLCDPTDGSPLGSSVPGILQTRTLEWVAISFSIAWKWKVKAKSLSCVRLLVTPWTSAYQAPPSMGFSRQEYWSEVPLPSLNKRIQLFVTPWTAACQVSLSPTISQSLVRFMVIESVMLSNHLILCCLLLLCLQSFPASGSFPMSQLFASGDQSIGASASVLPMSIELISFSIDRFELLTVQRLSRVFSSTTVQKHEFFGPHPSFW